MRCRVRPAGKTAHTCICERIHPSQDGQSELRSRQADAARCAHKIVMRPLFRTAHSSHNDADRQRGTQNENGNAAGHAPLALVILLDAGPVRWLSDLALAGWFRPEWTSGLALWSGSLVWPCGLLPGRGQPITPWRPRHGGHLSHGQAAPIPSEASTLPQEVDTLPPSVDALSGHAQTVDSGHGSAHCSLAATGRRPAMRHYDMSRWTSRWTGDTVARCRTTSRPPAIKRCPRYASGHPHCSKNWTVDGCPVDGQQWTGTGNDGAAGNGPPRKRCLFGALSHDERPCSPFHHSPAGCENGPSRPHSRAAIMKPVNAGGNACEYSHVPENIHARLPFTFTNTEEIPRV